MKCCCRQTWTRRDASETEGWGFRERPGIKLLLHNMFAWPPGCSRSAVRQKRAELRIGNPSIYRDNYFIIHRFTLGTKASAALWRGLTLLEEGLQKASPAGMEGAFSGQLTLRFYLKVSIRQIPEKKKMLKISCTLLWKPELMNFLCIQLLATLDSLIVEVPSCYPDNFCHCSLSLTLLVAVQFLHEGLTETVCRPASEWQPIIGRPRESNGFNSQPQRQRLPLITALSAGSWWMPKQSPSIRRSISVWPQSISHLFL